MELENGLKLLDLERDTLQDVVLKFNHNMHLLLSVRDELAGRGLKLDGRTLRLDVPKVFVTDSDGQLIALTSSLTANQNSNVSQPSTLQEYLDYLVSELRKIKGTANWTDPLSGTISDTLTLVASLVSDYYRLNEDMQDLVQELSDLTLKYEQLVNYYHSHKHKASDVVEGVFDPRRLGVNEPTGDKRLRGDGQWI